MITLPSGSWKEYVALGSMIVSNLCQRWESANRQYCAFFCEIIAYASGEIAILLWMLEYEVTGFLEANRQRADELLELFDDRCILCPDLIKLVVVR